ncbi:PqiA/YebS family transporter subunit [soil metagenome]
MQRRPSVAGYDLLLCAECDCQLERRTGRSLATAFALSATTLILLIPANLFPFLTTSVLGASRESHLVSSVTVMWRQDWPLLAIAIALFLIVLPIVRFALLTTVLFFVHGKTRPAWLGRAFRWSNGLQIWAMADVFLLGLLVAYERLSATIQTTLGIGAYCFIGAAIATLFTRATLDTDAIWERIQPSDDARDLEGVVTCGACEMVMRHPEPGCRCPRCDARIDRRIPDALSGSIALTLAGVLLYIPANLYAIARIPVGLNPTSYTILGGVIELVDVHLVGLAALVFIASFAIPIFKLIGLAWCIASVLRRSTFALSTKTKTYRIVEEIGRWSMIDPFVVACFVPVTQYNASFTSSAEPAATYFTAVVVLTMMAAHIFDPRLMWDAARGRTS